MKKCYVVVRVIEFSTGERINIPQAHLEDREEAMVMSRKMDALLGGFMDKQVLGTGVGEIGNETFGGLLNRIGITSLGHPVMVANVQEKSQIQVVRGLPGKTH